MLEVSSGSCPLPSGQSPGLGPCGDRPEPAELLGQMGRRGVSLNPGPGRRQTPGEVRSLPAIPAVSEDGRGGLWLTIRLLFTSQADDARCVSTWEGFLT